MAHDPPELIACPECGCLDERGTALLAQAKETINELERELRTKRSKITELKGERRDKLRNSPRYEEALGVLQHWRDVCMPSAKELDSPDRLSAVLARLSGGHTAEELKTAATGYSRRPYVTREGRSSSGTPAERKVDAALIYSTPKHVANGIAFAATTSSSSPITSGSIERLSWRRVKDANRRFIVRSLQESMGTKGLENGDYLELPCPRCRQREPEKDVWLSIAPPDLSYIVRCWNCGLDETRLIAAIQEDSNEVEQGNAAHLPRAGECQ